MTHILSIPLNFEEIIPNYDILVNKIKALNVTGVKDHYFQASN